MGWHADILGSIPDEGLFCLNHFMRQVGFQKKMHHTASETDMNLMVFNVIIT